MSTRTHPHDLDFLFIFLALLILWVIIWEIFMKHAELPTIPVTPLQRALWWFVPPLAVVFGFFLFQWGRKEYRAQQDEQIAHAQQQARAEREEAEAEAVQLQKDREHFTLEVRGLGISVDRYCQDELWEALQQGDPHTTILPQDPKAYPWSENEKLMNYGSRSGGAYEMALKSFPEKWEIPFLLGGPPLRNPRDANSLKSGLCAVRTGMGMHYHRFRTVSQVYDICPDLISRDTFSLFDQDSNLPAAAIAVEDGLITRESVKAPNDPYLVKDGYREPGEMTESTAVILLTRRDRVDMLRPTATNIRIEDIQVKIETVPRASGNPIGPDHILSYDDAPPEPQFPDRSNNLKPFWEVQGGAPAAFKPSRFVRRPWCKEQLAQFDALKILARVHRPQTAQYVKSDKPLGPKERENAFLEAWRKALATLPEGQKPARVVYEYGPKGSAHLAPLKIAIRAAGPDLDISGKDGLDVTQRVGDTGADAPYVTLALGILATQQEGGISAVVSLRREDRATVTMVSPP